MAASIIILIYTYDQCSKLVLYANPAIQTDTLPTNLRSIGNITASDYNIDLAFGLIPA